MSDHESSPPADPPSTRAPASPSRTPAPRRRGVAAALALLLSVLALAAAGFAGWQLWQLRRSHAATAQGMQAMDARVQSIQQRVDALSRQREALHRDLGQLQSSGESLSQQIAGLSQRTGNLEDAVTRLSRRTVSGRDQLLLNQAELLLRMGQARYTLFHDAEAAARAYAMAGQALQAEGDPAYSGVRQRIDDAVATLHKAQSGDRGDQLQQLATWRAQLAHWPLKAAQANKAPAHPGFWARVGHALSQVVRVQRDTGTAWAAADAHLSRELTALDLAQAQAARLAFDEDGFRRALKQADGALAAYFDTQATPVKQARARIHAWLQAAPPASVDLGAALHELQHVRSVRGEAAAGNQGGSQQ